MQIMSKIPELIDWILSSKNKFPSQQGFIVAISGIDASGKGYLATQLVNELSKRNHSVFLEHLDGWLNLPKVRFSQVNKAENFYQNAFRLEELKSQILMPYYQENRVNCSVLYLEETWTNFHNRQVRIEDYEILIIEGIFLFQPKLLPFFALKIWIDCSWETALQRAIARNQEELSSTEIIAAYNNIYFPAQKLHFQKDNPQNIADIQFVNDLSKHESFN